MVAACLLCQQAEELLMEAEYEMMEAAGGGTDSMGLSLMMLERKQHQVRNSGRSNPKNSHQVSWHYCFSWNGIHVEE